MTKVEIKFNYIAEWTDKSARVLVLQTKDETVSFPVIISDNEAFNLIKEIENLQLKRPQTHDLVFDIMKKFNIKLHTVYIYNLLEGIFYTKIQCSNQEKNIEIESRISDALILALKYNCPVYIENSILEQVGMPKETKEDETVYDNTNNLSYKSIEELKELLDEAIENENYEYASLIRDEIKQKENID